MNELQIFNYGTKAVRTVDMNNETWWVLKDVCEALGIDNSRNIATRLDDDEKGVHTMDTLGGKQELAIISESGVYNVVFQSRKAEAKRFKRWVTHEVLPTLRRTKSYSIEPAANIDAEKVLLARALLVGKELIALQKEMMNLREGKFILPPAKPKLPPEEIARLRFRAERGREIEPITVGDFAKEITSEGFSRYGMKITEVMAYKWFRDNGYLGKKKKSGRGKLSVYNRPTKKAVTENMLCLEIVNKVSSSGKSYIKRVTKITGEGQIYFRHEIPVMGENIKANPKVG